MNSFAFHEQKGAPAGALTKEQFQEELRSRQFRHLRTYCRMAEPADIAERLDGLSSAETIVLFRLIPKRRRAEIFAYLSFDIQERLLGDLPDNVVTNLVNEMEADDRTRLLEDLPVEIRGRILLKLSPEERRTAWQLLSYPEDSVGRLMNPEFIALRADMKVAQAVDFLRWNTVYPEDLATELFVTDAVGKLKGQVSLAALVLADAPGVSIESLMEPSNVTLKPDDIEEMAVDIFRKYDQSVIPVVDAGNVLLGIVTADDVFDVAEEDATEDIQQFGGQATLEDSYFETPLVTLVRKRAGWLLLLFFGEIFTGTALHKYDDAIASMRYLVYFVPLIISSGGNSGSQAASLVIRGLAVNEMRPEDFGRVFRREALAGLALGVILGIIGFIRATTWGQSPMVGLSVGITLVIVVLFGGILGAMMPFVMKSFRLDPAVSSSPFIASLSDVAGILIYFQVATWMMS
jgi:magnesium transporter